VRRRAVGKRNAASIVEELVGSRDHRREDATSDVVLAALATSSGWENESVGREGVGQPALCRRGGVGSSLRTLALGSDNDGARWR